MAGSRYDAIDPSHFLRDWTKLPVEFVRGAFRKLSPDAQATFFQLIAESEAESQIPGHFLDKETGEAWGLADLVYRVAGAADRLQSTEGAIGELRKAGLVDFERRDGFSIRDFDKFSVEKERKKVRDANAQRQRNKRNRDRQQGKVVALHQEASG